MKTRRNQDEWIDLAWAVGFPFVIIATMVIVGYLLAGR